jgi:cytochrome c
MSGVEVIKLILAAFTTVLIVLLIGNVVNELSHKEPLERNAYAVLAADEAAPATPEPAGQAAAAPAAESFTAQLASADPAAGQKASKRCVTCHTFNEGGSKKIGPNLWGIVGQDKGTVDGFKYSDAMRDKGGAWSYGDLNAFLANPKGFLKGTRMSFSGVRSVQDRAAIIAYMRQQSSNPLPLPGQ